MDRDALELVESDVPKTFPQWVLLARLKLSTATKICFFMCYRQSQQKVYEDIHPWIFGNRKRQVKDTVIKRGRMYKSPCDVMGGGTKVQERIQLLDTIFWALLGTTSWHLWQERNRS